MRHIIIPIIALALTIPAAAQTGHAPFTIQQTGQGFATIDEAVQSVRMGTATILIAPGVYHQCTIQAGGVITFKAVQPGTAIFDGTACEGKAAFVLRGQGSTVDGLVFRNLRVADGNGACIRTDCTASSIVAKPWPVCWMVKGAWPVCAAAGMVSASAMNGIMRRIGGLAPLREQWTQSGGGGR